MNRSMLWHCALVLAGLAGAAVHLLSTRPIQAAPDEVTERAPAAEKRPEATGSETPALATSLADLSVLVSAGYGASTSKVRGMELSPFAASFGLDVGYAFHGGFRVGAYGSYSLGRTVEQRYEPFVRAPFDLTTDTSSVNAGLTVGQVVPVHFLRLRYTLGIGVTSMKWDFGDVDAVDVRYSDAKYPSLGLHFAPGAAILWPVGPFESGIGFDYFIQASGTLPNAFMGKLLAGVRL